MSLPTLLLTRPEASSRRFLNCLPDRVLSGVRPCVSPLIEVEPSGGPVDLTGVRGVIFSSANAVRAVEGRVQPGIAAYCIGMQTCRAAQAAGWDARQAGTNAAELIAALSQTAAAGPLLHLRGTHSTGDIAGELRRAGLRAEARVVYDQPARPLTPAARGALDGDTPVIVPIFSARTARLFAELAAPRAPLYVAVISDAVARALSGVAARQTLTARAPQAAEMAACVETLWRMASRVEGAQRPK